MISPNKSCAICGKGYRRAISRSHSMRATIRRLQPNLQWFRLPARPPGGPSGQRIKACTKCIKSITRGKIKLAAQIPSA